MSGLSPTFRAAARLVTLAACRRRRAHHAEGEQANGGGGAGDEAPLSRLPADLVDGVLRAAAWPPWAWLPADQEGRARVDVPDGFQLVLPDQDRIVWTA